MTAVISPTAYWSATILGACICAALCTAARLCPGRWAHLVARAIGLVLISVAASYTIGLLVAGTWSARTDLPFALCDMAVLIAAAACFTEVPVLVELTYFWGVAGTLQGLLTPDLGVAYPHLEFFEYVVGHAAIVTAALFLVIGLRLVPRPGAVPRVFAITVAYAAAVGVVDWAWGANYMFLRHPPAEWTLLRLLGPWPWYLASATALAFVLVVLLDLPFWPGRRRASRSGEGQPSDHLGEQAHVGPLEHP